MKEEFPFTPREQQVLSRGRNSVSGSRNRRNPAAYQDSTALEAIVGYLYITDSKRCEELLNWIHNNLERANE
jgi:ribonuclease-3 family protein